MVSTITPTPLGNRCPANAGDKGFRLSSGCADADGSGLARDTTVANIDIVTARGEIDTGMKAQCDVVAAGCVVQERFIPMAVLSLPVVLLERSKPSAVLLLPVVLL